jgi:hypothetical protein
MSHASSTIRSVCQQSGKKEILPMSRRATSIIHIFHRLAGWFPAGGHSTRTKATEPGSTRSNPPATKGPRRPLNVVLPSSGATPRALRNARLGACSSPANAFDRRRVRSVLKCLSVYRTATAAFVAFLQRLQKAFIRGNPPRSNQRSSLRGSLFPSSTGDFGQLANFIVRIRRFDHCVFPPYGSFARTLQFVSAGLRYDHRKSKQKNGSEVPQDCS